MKHRVYVAGPYSASDSMQIYLNVRRASDYAAAIMQRGHLAHSPHNATHWIAELYKGCSWNTYENWMELDFSIIDHWATALYVIDESPGVLREIERARERHLPIWRSLDEVPRV